MKRKQDLQELSSLNEYFEDVLQRFPGQNECSTAAELPSVRSNIYAAATTVKTLNGQSSSFHMDAEITQLRRNLQRLLQLLQEMHSRLLSQQLLLRVQQQHLHAASTWAAVSKNAL